MINNKKNKLNILLRDKAFIISFIVLLSIIIIALFAPLFSRYDVDGMEVSERLQKPFFMNPDSKEHFLGTDALGRDLFTRIAFGLRNSFLIATLSVIVMFSVGIIIGLISGLSKSKIVSQLIMTMTEILFPARISFPDLSEAITTT